VLQGLFLYSGISSSKCNQPTVDAIHLVKIFKKRDPKRKRKKFNKIKTRTNTRAKGDRLSISVSPLRRNDGRQQPWTIRDSLWCAKV
jgi:hypothetical protein